MWIAPLLTNSTFFCKNYSFLILFDSNFSHFHIKESQLKCAVSWLRVDLLTKLEKKHSHLQLIQPSLAIYNTIQFGFNNHDSNKVSLDLIIDKALHPLKMCLGLSFPQIHGADCESFHSRGSHQYSIHVFLNRALTVCCMFFNSSAQTMLSVTIKPCISSVCVNSQRLLLRWVLDLSLWSHLTRTQHIIVKIKK